jgi:hypothetical protein
MSRIIAVIFLSVSIPSGHAATQSEFEAFRSQQSREVQKVRSEFNAYKEKQDAEFADFLKARWSEFETYKGIRRIKEPKPRVIPVAKPKPYVEPPIPDEPKAKQANGMPSSPSALDSPAPIAPPEVKPAVISPLPQRPQEDKQAHQQLPRVPNRLAANEKDVAFYGNPVRFPFDSKWSGYNMAQNPAAESISAFWLLMSESEYEPFINAMQMSRKRMELDDWGHVSLIRAAVETLQPGKDDEQKLLLWFFLIKSGYDVRLGYSGNNVHLFVAIGQHVFATKFTKVGAQKYYAVLDRDLGASIGSFYTYSAKYPGKLRPINIKTAATAFTKKVAQKRELSFEYQGKKIHLNVAYDRALVDYLTSFPQSDFDLYFDTDGSNLVRQGLLEELRRHVQGRSEEDAVNFLLAFVQKAFAYKTDDDQFGHEKYFFVEESLHYPYNDCEDRSVIFAWLVHELVGDKVVGLLYPGHMTTAVALKSSRQGLASISHQGERYVIADPTYIGATLGMPMPSYAKVSPNRVVDIDY